jgi:hypothetical protein
MRHEELSEALWAHHISRHCATKVTPFEVVYGQEIILLIEVKMLAYRLSMQNKLSVVDYDNLIMDNIDEVTDKRLQDLKEIEKDKIWVAKPYNKKVKQKFFQVSDLGWKIILPVPAKGHKFGKCSLSSEGPYKIVKVITENSYLSEKNCEVIVFLEISKGDIWRNTTQVCMRMLE